VVHGRAAQARHADALLHFHWPPTIPATKSATSRATVPVAKLLVCS
jgi:hypothetical protein